MNVLLLERRMVRSCWKNKQAVEKVGVRCYRIRIRFRHNYCKFFMVFFLSLKLKCRCFLLYDTSQVNANISKTSRFV